MQRAIELARQCVSEPGRISPKVGAVVARDGKVLADAYRGELDRRRQATELDGVAELLDAAERQVAAVTPIVVVDQAEPPGSTIDSRHPSR